MANELIRMGLQIPLFTYPDVADEDLFERIASIATTAEQGGFDSVFVMDHFYQLPGLGRPNEPMFEAYSLLTAIAARTSRVRLGAMVGGMTYRNPAYLAKTVTGLDVISKGRAIWGIGAGWFELEHQHYGYEFGTFTDRFEKLEEGLQIVTSMFRNDQTTFSGKWFQVTDAYNVPRPIQAGGPPILIGGSGEKKTLRMVAQYADAGNTGAEIEELPRKMAALDEHCERLARDRREIVMSFHRAVCIAPTREQAQAEFDAWLETSGLDADQQANASRRTLIGGPDDVAEQLQRALDAGLDGFTVNAIANGHIPGRITLLGETAKALL